MGELLEWGNGSITIRLAIDEAGIVRLVNFGPANSLAPDVPFPMALGPVEIQFAGDQLPQGSRHVELGGTARLTYRSHEISTVGDVSMLTLNQHDAARGIRVESIWAIDGSDPVLRCRSLVTNSGGAPVTLEYVSSFTYNGFVRFAEQGWAANTTIAIPHNTFCGEFQWAEHTLPDLGVYDVGFAEQGIHSSKKRIVAGSVGTQPTTEYLPMGAITDHARGVSWAWQIEHNGSWHWEVGDHRTGVYLAAAGPTDQEHQWRKVLAPGQSFEPVPIALTAVVGELADVFVPLSIHRRTIRRPNADNENLPVIFNDYMNSILAEPTEAKLLPVIAAAAAAGSEYYCVDAGWYSDEPGWWNSVGAWTEASGRFPHGLSFLFDAIRAAGMIPGLWIEPEVVGIDSSVVRELPDDAFFWRNGARVNGAGRYQLDFHSPAVIERMDAVIERLAGEYSLGYLKFDYNINGGIGTDIDSDSPGDGLLGHNRAFLAWIDRLFERHPDLVIEACASGGARVDYATLARHSILSTSDQTDHLRYVPIAAAAPTGVTPEQAAVWVCPQPEFSDDELELCIVNGLLARPQLSGGIWKLSASQMEIVAAGIAVYKEYRHVIPTGLPQWPLGLPHWDDAWISQALVAPDGIYIAVWRRGGGDSATLPLPIPAGTDVSVEVLFPAGGEAGGRWDSELGELSVTLLRSPSARLIRVTPKP